jgi:hypothetical protein
VLCTAAPALLVYTLANAPAWGWAADRTLGLLTAGALLPAALLTVEARTRSPLIRLGLFRIRPVAILLATAATLMTAPLPRRRHPAGPEVSDA